MSDEEISASQVRFSVHVGTLSSHSFSITRRAERGSKLKGDGSRIIQKYESFSVDPEHV